MISREKELKLIAIYLYICDLYNSTLKFECQRFSNNAKPDFTDQELMTIYLFVGYEQRYFQINEIHSFTKDYLLDWFPKLSGRRILSWSRPVCCFCCCIARRGIVGSAASQCPAMFSGVQSR